MRQGHIHPRGNGVWQLKWDLPRDGSGKRRQRYKTVRGSKRDAERELRRILSSIDENRYVDASRITVGEYLDRWLKRAEARGLAPKTLERYRQLIENNIKPRLGFRQIQRVGVAELKDFYAALQIEDNLAPRTIRHVHRRLHRAFRDAANEQIIANNPMARVSAREDLPSIERRRVEILEPAQVQTLLAKLEGRSLQLPVIVALGTGVRRGELLALRWNDVDLDGAKLRVDESLEETRPKGAQAKLNFKEPKTKSGTRTISISPVVVTALREHRRRMLEAWLELGLGRLPDDALVFGRYDSATQTWVPRSPNGLTREWIRAAKSVGIAGTTFHALRHTHASQLLAAGVDIVTVSRRLGHASPAITLGVYGHLLANADQKAAEVIERIFSGAAERG